MHLDMRLLFTVLFTVTITLSSFAQNFITGSVIRASDLSPIAGANVLLTDANGRAWAYSVSDDGGKFSMRRPSINDTLFINVKKVGFRSYSTPLVFNDHSIVIELEEEALKLKEVVIKADRIRERGDTITYNVSSFSQKQDRTIGDVLKRLPGIDVANNGKIQYQGIDINKFYIEGNDILGGKYGIATNGISYVDIGAVEVMENHQPLQVLQGLSFSDQAAINLKLKHSAKASILIHGTLAGGWSEQPEGMLWQGDIFTMMITEKYQTITTFKGNKTGMNLSDQLLDFTTNNIVDRIKGYISLSIPVTPNLQQKRSYFNRSWMASSTHLFKTKKGGVVNAQINYNKDRVSVQGASSTTYFLDSGEKIVIEDKNSLSHRNAVTGKFSYEANEKSYFLNNTLSTDFSWNDEIMHVTGSLPSSQSASQPEYSISNLLKIIKRFNNSKLVTFSSRNEWNSLPERLSISHDFQNYGQKIKQHSFYTEEVASLDFVFNKALLSFETGMSGYFRKLNTDLFGVEMAEVTRTEALTTDYLCMFASPKLEWNYKKLELSLRLPVNLYSYFFSGFIGNRTECFLSPSITTRFRITSRMSLTFSGSTRRSPVSLHDIHESSILTDYRLFSTGVEDYYTSSGQSLSASYNYRNASNGIFVMAMGSYGWNKSKFMTVQNLVGDYVFHSYQSQPSSSRNAMAFSNVSKTIDFMRGAIGVKGYYRRVKSSLLSQGLPTNYCNDTFSLSPFINGNISTYLNWTYRFTWNKSWLTITNISNSRSNNYIHSGDLTVTPCSLITWTTGGEFYCNQIEEGHYKKMAMLDTKFTFNISKRLEISAAVTNLFNRKEYSYISFGTVAQYKRSSKLRGREFMISIYLKK